MTSKIKMRCTGIVPASRDAILAIFSNFGVKCSRLISPSAEKRDYLVLCHSDLEADRVFDDDCVRALNAIHCEPVLPMNLKAKRSIIVKRIDSFIYDNCTADDIMTEFNDRNDSLTAVSVFKFPNSKTMKVTFRCQSMAVTCANAGFKMFNLFIGPFDIQEEEYFDVMLCYRCYSWNTHLTHQCPKPRDYIICSSCSELGHVFRACTSTKKCCLNCNQNHASVSYSCPERKRAVSEIKQGKIDGNAISGRVKVSSYSTESVDCGSSNDAVVKSILCLVAATAKENEDPGSFDATLKYLQTINKVPDFKLGTMKIPSLISLGKQNDPLDPVRATVGVDESSTDAVTDDRISDAGESLILGASSNRSEVQKMSAKTGALPKTPRNTLSGITIIKRKTAPKVTTGNLEEMFRTNQIIFENTSNMSQEDCLEALKTNLIDCKLAVLSVKTKDFRTVMKNTGNN